MRLPEPSGAMTDVLMYVFEHNCHDYDEEIWGERATLSDSSFLSLYLGSGAVHFNIKSGAAIHACDSVYDLCRDICAYEGVQ